MARPKRFTRAEIRSRHKMRKLGEDPELFSTLLRKQNFRCAICGKHQDDERRHLQIDHCHKSGKVRGLLCWNCNSSLGKLGDDFPSLKKALEYLKR